jgi:hypothetical protein
VEAELRPSLVEDLLERLADVRDDELGSLGDILAVAGREVVDDPDIVAAGKQYVDYVRADEAGASCDDRPHRFLS